MEKNTLLIHAILSLINVKESQNLVEEFCKEKYKEKFDKNKIRIGEYHTFKNFEIISESEIKINYSYGYGDFEYDGNFIVKI